MMLTSTHKIFFLLIFTQGILTSQEKLFNQADALLIKYKNKYEELVKHNKLLAFAQSVGKNPAIFLSSITPFYKKRSWWTSISSPFYSLKKLALYCSTARSINKAVYLPEAFSILTDANEPKTPWLTQEGHDQCVEKLETLAYSPELKKQATQKFNEEWPFLSVRLDLTSLQLELADLYNEFSIEKNKLCISEQTDNRFETFKAKCDKHIDLLRRAIYAISCKKDIAALNENAFAALFQLIKRNGTLEEESYMIAFPLEQVNVLYKTQNPDSNGLLHEICINSELSDQQKESTIRFLEEKGIHVNDHNKDGKTPLDLLKQDPENKIRQVLIDLGGQNSLPKVNSLRKSYDTPPASPQPKQVTFESK
ncbi:MAG: hypothetical protein AMXMBFR12_02710 [Candidatus Babeliales bacterium]